MKMLSQKTVCCWISRWKFANVMFLKKVLHVLDSFKNVRMHESIHCTDFDAVTPNLALLRHTISPGDVIENFDALRKLEPKTAPSKDEEEKKQRISEAKHIRNRKRKGLADLFKLLKSMGEWDAALDCDVTAVLLTFVACCIVFFSLAQVFLIGKGWFGPKTWPETSWFWRQPALRSKIPELSARRRIQLFLNKKTWITSTSSCHGPLHSPLPLNVQIRFVDVIWWICHIGGGMCQLR